MRIACIVGCRPNFVKIAPLLREMKKYPDIDPVLIHTGQHKGALSDPLFRDLNIPEPSYNLGEQTLQAMFQALKPSLRGSDLVLVVGDTDSSLAGALAAETMHIPIAHVEAGLRSFDRSMPEETNRILIDSVSKYLFASEPSAIKNLQKEGNSQEIFFVGNVMIDSLIQRIPERTYSYDYALLTLHRPSNVDSQENFDALMKDIQKIALRIPVIFPVHPRTAKRNLPVFQNLNYVEPMSYNRFCSVLQDADFVMTDSGGVQEESTYFGVPCLTLRYNTERPVTVDIGTNTLVGNSPSKEAFNILNGTYKLGKRPFLWDGHTAERIVAILYARHSCHHFVQSA